MSDKIFVDTNILITPTTSMLKRNRRRQSGFFTNFGANELGS